MHSAISANKRNSVIVIGIFVLILTGMCVVMAYWLNNLFWPAVTMITVLIYTVVQYFQAGKWTMSQAGAIEITKSENARLWRVVENLCITSGLPMPRVFVIEDASPNALAAGRDSSHAFVAATTGLLEIMDDSELEAVFAHEISHVKNYDVRVKTIVFGLIAAVAVLSKLAFVGASAAILSSGRIRKSSIFVINLVIGAFLAIMVAILGTVAFLVGPIIRAAVSQQREYSADISAVELTRYPPALISALQKIERFEAQPSHQVLPAMSHLYFSNPNRESWISGLLSSHPSLEKRISRLEKTSNSL
jgi:heat shock protein HtpX